MRREVEFSPKQAAVAEQFSIEVRCCVDVLLDDQTRADHARLAAEAMEGVHRSKARTI